MLHSNFVFCFVLLCSEKHFSWLFVSQTTLWRKTNPVSSTECQVFFPRAVMVASKQAKHKCKFNVNAWLQCKKGISYSAMFKGALHPKIKLHIFPRAFVLILHFLCVCELPNSKDINLRDVWVLLNIMELDHLACGAQSSKKNCI